MHIKKIEYQDGGAQLEGYLAVTDETAKKKPAVIICHDWSGRNEFTEKKAEQLAELGYVGFALDIFGKGKLGKTKEEKMQLIQPFAQDRAKLRRRINAALEVVKKLEQVDATRIAVIGFCFGGMCALDLARDGADIRGVVSFHGLLSAPENIPNKTIKAKILVLHGYDDPMANPQQSLAFEQEMTQVKADWQMHVYSNTMHAFTNPVANDPAFGTLYNALAATRSWISMQNFLKEIFE